MTEAIAEGRFREDLYYRLNTIPVKIPPLRERAEDIVLLFRKFANEISEKYNMPPVRLADDARQVLMRYPWPGNIRQLKNITEQISIIEPNREISADILRNYIPETHESHELIALNSGKSHSFENEREILYQILFDLRKDVTELKRLVNERHSARTSSMSDSCPSVQAIQVRPSNLVDADIQDPEEYVEESFSLTDSAKQIIAKALEKNHGRRRDTAADLGISERTLYRKIKEYGLE